MIILLVIYVPICNYTEYSAGSAWGLPLAIRRCLWRCLAGGGWDFSCGVRGRSLTSGFCPAALSGLPGWSVPASPGQPENLQKFIFGALWCALVQFSAVVSPSPPSCSSHDHLPATRSLSLLPASSIEHPVSPLRLCVKKCLILVQKREVLMPCFPVACRFHFENRIETNARG